MCKFPEITCKSVCLHLAGSPRAWRVSAAALGGSRHPCLTPAARVQESMCCNLTNPALPFGQQGISNAYETALVGVWGLRTPRTLEDPAGGAAPGRRPRPRAQQPWALSPQSLGPVSFESSSIFALSCLHLSSVPPDWALAWLLAMALPGPPPLGLVC